MNRSMLFAIAVCCASATANASAEDYLLRLETTGYVDRPLAEVDPQEVVLRSIEVVARPGSPFRAKVIMGKETLTFAGKLHPAKDGAFRVEMRYEYSIDTGAKTVSPDGRIVASPSSTSAQTGLYVTVGKLTTVNELHTLEKTCGRQLQSVERVVLLLSKTEPEMD